MQTFLPYESFIKSAQTLDNRRLGKQRIECIQILKSLYGISKKGWKNHPAILMWKGYEFSLIQYSLAICKVWKSKGFKDSCEQQIIKIYENYFTFDNFQNPPWLGNIDFHNSHKSNLLRKNMNFYSQYNWGVSNNLEYIWPRRKNE